MIPLSPQARLRLEALFSPEKRDAAEKLLVAGCGDGLPTMGPPNDDFWDRIRFAVLKLSDGDLKKLEREVELANRDWRDTLVCAEFADDVKAHRSWFPGAR